MGRAKQITIKKQLLNILHGIDMLKHSAYLVHCHSLRTKFVRKAI
jgi:hypothetical protein